MSSDQSTNGSASRANSPAGLLSLSNEILTQTIANLDLTPSDHGAVTAICLALTCRRLFNIINAIIGGDQLRSLCPRPKYWYFIESDYKLEVQDRLTRHWKEYTRSKWGIAVPYLSLVAKLKDGSMDVMEDQGYVFDMAKAMWIKPE